MKTPSLLNLAACTLLTLTASNCASAQDKEQKPIKVSFAAGIDHASWGEMLKKYVDERGLVDYAGWKGNETDIAALDSYLEGFGEKPETPAKGDELAAAATNAYNAFAIRDIIRNFPTDSIMNRADAFSKKSHLVAGKKVSLDDIEKGTVIPTIGWKGHGIVVCCARSCPPLQRFAYEGSQLQEQIDKAFSAWMAREDLHRFLPEENTAKVSKIFEWYAGDFKKAGGVRKVLAMYAPAKFQDFASGDDYKVEYLDYDWGLNDQGDRGKSYGPVDDLIDKTKKLGQ
jgi:hypothetical protein